MAELDLGTPPVSKADKIRCLKREIAMRERAYPRWVLNGKMEQKQADREIAVMKAVLHDYEAAP